MTNEAYREKLAELEEQNGYLREAATRFGELAERLNEELKKTRRSSAGRAEGARP
jgi:signal transduction protein with GAF and PtsI domain